MKSYVQILDFFFFYCKLHESTKKKKKGKEKPLDGF
jgi:hypothetical protein